MNSFENGRGRESGKLLISSYAMPTKAACPFGIATSWLSFFQSAETSENTTFALILMPFVTDCFKVSEKEAFQSIFIFKVIKTLSP